MSSHPNKLTPMRRAELPNLRDLYLGDWPRNIAGYYTLDNFIRWLEKDPHIKALSVLTLNNDWSDGTFVVIDRYELFVNTLNRSNERLTIALSLLDWSRGYKVSSFLERHRPAVLSIVESNLLQKEYDHRTRVYYMPRDEAIRMEINCPEGLYVRELQEEHAAIADSVWPNRHVGSLFFLRRLIAWNPNVGVFTRDNDELVGWCFRSQGGFLGVLQVKDAHQCKGIGGLVLRAITKKLGEMGHDAMACVTQENIPSRKIFERCGFRVIDTAYWMRTYPTVDFAWSDE